MALRITARVHHVLQCLARDEQLRQWRIVIAALQKYEASPRAARKER